MLCGLFCTLVRVMLSSFDTATCTSGEAIKKIYAYKVYRRTRFENVVVFSAFLNQPCYFEVSILDVTVHNYATLHCICNAGQDYMYIIHIHGHATLHMVYIPHFLII